MTTDQSKQIAGTILQQLGGNKFIAMTGASGFTCDGYAMSFRLPGGGGFCRNGINAVKITLDPDDTYCMQFYKIRGSKITTIDNVQGVYNDMLQDVFTAQTGLDTHL